MAKRHGIVYPPEIRELLEEARKAGQGSAPRQHHLIPRFYLDRWAEEKQIRVTTVDEARTHLTSPTRAAKQRDYYSLQHPDVEQDEVPPLLMETMLGRLEGDARRIIGRLADQDPGPAELAGMDFYLMASFLAFQITRGHAFREEQSDYITNFMRLKYGDLSDAQIERHLADQGLQVTPEVLAEHRGFLDELAAGDIRYRHPRAAEAILSARAATKLGEHLFTRNWVTYETRPLLITCDEPVLILGGPGLPRDERAGVATAGVVLFPLGPSRLLTLFSHALAPRPPWTLDAVETTEVNHEILASAARWAFERPSRMTTTRMQVPPLPAEPVRLEGPFPHPGGRPGEMFRFSKPTRWSTQSPMPPWPVTRWWR